MNEQAEIYTLSDIECGRKCVIKRVRGGRVMAKRLIEMGIGTGSEVEVERIAPLGEPVEIKVKGCHLSIRWEEARNIEVGTCEDLKV